MNTKKTEVLSHDHSNVISSNTLKKTWHTPELHKSLLRNDTNSSVGAVSDGSSGRGIPS